jgi:hypothetical protein
MKGRDHFGITQFHGNNIKMDFKEIYCEDMDYIHLYQGAVSGKRL